MPTINIVCRDRVQPARMLRWSPAKATTVATELTALFRRITEGTDYQAAVSFGEGAPGSNGLIVHFLGTRESSIIKRLTGQFSGTAAGATFPVGGGMISEVYVANISVVPKAIANLAFHELMHNKLDAQTSPRDRVVRDIHTQGGGGLATANPINESTQLTPRNIELMQGALGHEIPQYTGR